MKELLLFFEKDVFSLQTNLLQIRFIIYITVKSVSFPLFQYDQKNFFKGKKQKIVYHNLVKSTGSISGLQSVYKKC